MIRKLDN
jgi:hypothetical protein